MLQIYYSSPIFDIIPKHLIKTFLSRFTKKYQTPPLNRYWYYRWKHSIKLKKASSIRSDAVSLYKQMYTAFSRGDLATLQRICVPELAENFRRQIAARDSRNPMDWHFHALTSSSIASDLTIPLPQGLIVRQVVVKIVSKQSLTRFNNNNKKKKSGEMDHKEVEAEPKKVTEYFVLNQLNVGKSQDKWRVWGTTEETDGEFFSSFFFE